MVIAKAFVLLIYSYVPEMRGALLDDLRATPTVAVAMQEFSSAETCAAAKDFYSKITSGTRTNTVVVCIPK